MCTRSTPWIMNLLSLFLIMYSAFVDEGRCPPPIWMLKAATGGRNDAVLKAGKRNQDYLKDRPLLPLDQLEMKCEVLVYPDKHKARLQAYEFNRRYRILGTLCSEKCVDLQALNSTLVRVFFCDFMHIYRYVDDR